MSMITAHSGSDGLPANSRQFLKTATRWPVDALEIDVRWRQDRRQLVLAHDQETEDSVLLADALAIFRRQSHLQLLNCDLKDANLAGQVMDLAQRSGLADKIILTGTISALEQRRWPRHVWRNVETLLPEVNFDQLLNDNVMFTQMLKQAKKEGCQWLNLPFQLLHPVNLALLKDTDFHLSVWTARDVATTAVLLANGAANVTSLAAHAYCRTMEGGLSVDQAQMGH